MAALQSHYVAVELHKAETRVRQLGGVTSFPPKAAYGEAGVARWELTDQQWTQEWRRLKKFVLTKRRVDFRPEICGQRRESYPLFAGYTV